MKEHEARGIKDPEGFKRKQKQREEMEKNNQAPAGNDGLRVKLVGNYSWNV